MKNKKKHNGVGIAVSSIKNRAFYSLVEQQSFFQAVCSNLSETH